MSKILLIILSFWIVGCGGGSDAPNKKLDLYDKQWNINSNSIFYEDGRVVKGSDIDMNNIWDRYQGNNIKVAVIDTCFDANHIDLKNNIIKTYNVNTGKNDVSCKNFDESHGTAVASVIGAIKTNNIGIVGVSPKVKLILIKVNFEISSDSDFINAFEYAKNQGAKIINCSWGSGHSSQALSDEFRNLKNNFITIVFSSGNEAYNFDTPGINDESEDPSVIGVGATGEDNDRTKYSSYGSNIDILAPGGEDIGIYVDDEYNRYTSEIGTSFSAPTISGVVALMLEKNPTLTPDQIREALIRTAQKVGTENGADYINGFDKYRAYGKVDAYRAINY